MNKTFDRYAGIVFLALGALCISESLKISKGAYGSGVGPNTLPMALGIVLILLSIRLIYETFRYAKSEKAPANLDYKRFAIIFAAALLYAFFIEDLGYVITTFLFLFVGFQTMERGRVWSSLIIAAVFSFGVYYLYVDVLEGTLPGFPSWLS
ncbi:tripartite tricarboxylate transporter TctB family protein [Paenibacillus hamazuiensis]|uniref:tripartite tricarboxylate transporter TctB family protein n=1 Tax=Paenibacillus hamazuiensis TaxID=2936508 RepID=UPI0020103A27|nr:tripartite tricarboxylate transporter TctB family protein [Paenibacillus hamazuiensis]